MQEGVVKQKKKKAVRVGPGKGRNRTRKTEKGKYIRMVRGEARARLENSKGKRVNLAGEERDEKLQVSVRKGRRSTGNF